MLRLAVLAALLLAACGKENSAKPAGDKGSAATAATDPCAKAKQHGTLKWIEDDYPAALACARAKKVPLVLDLWAPWCHTCISMQTTVFTDPSLAAKQDSFVFVALDTDREENAAPVGKFALSAWPTFYVVGTDEQVLARFVGAASVQEFLGFLDAGARAAGGGVAAADARLLGAERALAAKDLVTADEELTAAIAAAPPTWPRRAEAIASQLLTKRKRGDALGCVQLADANIDAVGRSAIATNFWATAIECAGTLAAQAPPKDADPAQAKRVQTTAIANLAKVIEDASAPLSVDDRAEAMSYLRDALDAQGKADEAKAVAEKLRLHVDEAYAKAPTPFARMTFIWPRAEVYAWLKRPLDLVDDYAKLSAELPTEYDPPARLGWLYMKGGKYAEAATWTDKALALVYGPRKGRLLNQRAEIAAAAGDKAAERKYREEAVKLWESLPEGQKSPENLAKAKAALAALDGTGSGSAK